TTQHSIGADQPGEIFRRMESRLFFEFNGVYEGCRNRNLVYFGAWNSYLLQRFFYRSKLLLLVIIFGIHKSGAVCKITVNLITVYIFFNDRYSFSCRFYHRLCYFYPMLLNDVGIRSIEHRVYMCRGAACGAKSDGVSLRDETGFARFSEP